MKNKVFAVLASVVILFCSFSPFVVAADLETAPDLVIDNADIFSAEEEAELEQSFAGYIASHGLEIAVLTVDTYEGKEAQAYADDYYDYNGFGYGADRDGLILVYNTGKLDGNRNLTVSTSGKAISLFSDADIDEIFDMMISYIKSGYIYAAFVSFDAACEEAVSGDFIFYGDNDGDGYDYDGGYTYDGSYDDGYVHVGVYRNKTPLYFIPLAIVIGFVISFIIVKVQASGLKSVRKKADAADYVSGVNLTGQRDTFLYRNVKRTPKPKNNTSSHGGGSVHMGSSGRSHGGGSRSF